MQRWVSTVNVCAAFVFACYMYAFCNVIITLGSQVWRQAFMVLLL